MKPLALWIVIAGLLIAMSLAGGCALDEIVSVDVPPNTRAHFRETLDTEIPPTLTLRDARILRREGDRRIEQRVKAQLANHAASNEALDAEITDGAFIESMIGSAINTGIETALPGLSSVPGGAILTTLLAGMGMWFAPRPGEAKRQAKQTKQAEDKGYDMGRQETLELVRNQG
ncbi:hypothetical protein OT109_10025 [Phycisphaeraceae bacterium D3-23]